MNNQSTVRPPVARAAQRWEGSAHSAANAIAAALRLLQFNDPADEVPTLRDLIAICSELVFRATGERIRPSVSVDSESLPTSLVVWRDCEDQLPLPHRIKLVRFEDGDVSIAHLCRDGTWGSDYCGGAHPGEWYEVVEVKKGKRVVSEDVRRCTEITAWADLPGEKE